MLKLNINERAIADIYSGLSAGCTKIKLNNITSSDDVMLLYKMCLSKHPEIINVDYGRILIQSGSDGDYLKVNPKVGWNKFKKAKCEFTPEDSRIMLAYAENIAIKLELSKRSDLKKAVAIHNYLTETVTYEDFENAHDAWGALIDQRAVCEGIAYAFCLLAKKCGLESVVVSGFLEGHPHAWNMVSINSKLYHLDVTSDLRAKGSGFKSYDYIFLKDSDLKDRTWNRNVYPVCSHNQHNYFIVTHSFASSVNEAVEIIERQLDNHKIVYFRCCDNFKLDENMVRLLFKKACKKTNRFFSSISFQINPTINTVQIIYK